MEGKKGKRLFLPQLFQDHMMLQREKTLRFYGEADEMVWKVSVKYTSKQEKFRREAERRYCRTDSFCAAFLRCRQMWEELFAFM